MPKTCSPYFLVVLAAVLPATPGCMTAPQRQDAPTLDTPPGDWARISMQDLEDKIRGGWAGQMIGVSFGAPTEFRYLGRIVPEEELPEWTPDRIENALGQDDIYVDITLARVLDERGLDATTEDFGAYFRDAQYDLWHANLAARRALRRGVPASLAGTPTFNVHANDIDFQIEADFIGLATPGMPRASNELGLRAGTLMNHGDGLYGGLFVGAMYAAAFFERDPRRIVEAGLAVLPVESPYARLITDVLDFARDHPEHWIAAWDMIQERWDRNESCPEGAFGPFNIEAKINGAYVALGLLYGGGDFARTMDIATRAGQDSDCNPATAAGVLGVVLGYGAIPGRFTSGFDAIAGRTFSYTDDTFESLVEGSVRRAVAMVERNGGRRDGDTLIVRLQTPLPAPYGVWDDYGVPARSIPVDDPAWSWTGDWAARTITLWGAERTSRASSTTGSEMTVRFRGTGAILTGWYLPTGGKADVYLDGTFSRTVDVYPDEPNVKLGEAIWHEFGLEDREHQLRLVVRGEPYEASDGADVAITSLSVFR